MRRPDRWRIDRFSIGIALIALAGLVGRVTYVVWMRNRSVGGDGPYYHFGANLLVDGHGFINPFLLFTTGREVPYAGHPPAWTLVLAGPSALGLRSYLSHQLVACLVGTATIVMTGLAGRVAFGQRVGLISAALIAVYPNAWIYEREVEAETLALLGVAITIWVAYRFKTRPSLAGAVALGAAVGFVTMSRPELIVLVVFLVLPLIATAAGVDMRRRVGWFVVAGVACAAFILPWAVYNSTRFDRPVPLTTSLGTTMLTGNCEQTYHGALLGYFRLGCAVLRRDISGDRSVADSQERRIAIEFMRDHASRVPVVMAARVGRTFGVFRPFQQMHLDRDRNSELWVIRSGFFMYWALLPFAVAGAVIGRTRDVPIYPLLVFPATVLLAVLFTIGETRYRATAEVSLVVLAAVGIDAAMTGVKRRNAGARRPAQEEIEAERIDVSTI